MQYEIHVIVEELDDHSNPTGVYVYDNIAASFIREEARAVRLADILVDLWQDGVPL